MTTSPVSVTSSISNVTLTTLTFLVTDLIEVIMEDVPFFGLRTILNETLFSPSEGLVTHGVSESMKISILHENEERMKYIAEYDSKAYL